MLPNDKEIRGSIQYREAAMEGVFSDDGSTVDISFSSEAPVERWYGIEILSHEPGAMVMDRASQGLPFLDNHDSDELVGRAENIRVEARKGRATIRFSSAEEAQGIKKDMQDRIRPDISFGYQILEYTITEGQGGAADRILVTSWRPYEITSVTIPADFSVGVGRAARMVKRGNVMLCEKCNCECCVCPKCGCDCCPECCQAGQPCPTCSTVCCVCPECGCDCCSRCDHRSLTGRKPPVSFHPAARSAVLPEVRMEPSITTPAAPVAPSNIVSLETRNQERAADLVAALQIRDLAGKFGVPPGDVDKILAERSLDEARKEIMFRITDKAPIVSAPVVELTPRESQQYSVQRAFGFALDLAEGRKPSGFEMDISQEVGKRSPHGYAPKGGVFVPFHTRTMDSLTAGSGNELKFTEYGGELIELLRNTAVILRLGTRVLSGMTSPIAFPTQTSDVTTQWIGENPPAGVTASTLGTGVKTISPKTLMATSKISRQLIQQAVYGAEQLVRESFVAAHALAYDKAAIHGIGANGEPTGVYQAASVNAEAMGSAVPTWTHLVSMVAKVLQANALFGKLGWATTPLMAGVLASTLKSSVAGATYLWEGKLDDGIIAGYQAIASNQISGVMSGSAATGGAEQGIVFGNWADSILGMFGAAEIIVDPYTSKNSGLVEYTSFQMVDFLLRHGASFSKSTAATLS